MNVHAFTIATATASTLLVSAIAQEVRLVPQFGSGELVATDDRVPVLRVDGAGRHVLQIHAQGGRLLQWQIEFPDRIIDAAWSAEDEAAWVATLVGIHRVDAAHGEVELVAPGCFGLLEFHRDGRWLGVLGTVQATGADAERSGHGVFEQGVSERAEGVLAVYDIVERAWIARHAVPTQRHASVGWVGDALHGSGAAGRGFRTRGGRGTIHWTHVAIDAPSATSEVIGTRTWNSRFEVDAPLLVAADVEGPYAWVERRGTDPGRSTRSLLRVDGAAIDHVMTGDHSGRGDWPGRWRLTREGFVEQIELPWEHATTWVGPARRRARDTDVPGLQSRVERGRLDVLWRTPEHLAAALLADEERDVLSRHAWDPRAGVLDQVWSRSFPVSELHWRVTTVDSNRDLLLLHGDGLPEAAFHVLDFETGETVHRFDGPQSLGPVAWSLDGQRVLVAGGREVSVYDRATETWVARWARASDDRVAFGVSDGWLVGARTRVRRYDDAGTLTGEFPFWHLQDLQVHPRGGRWAIASGQRGHAALVNLASMSVRSRWIESEGSSHTGFRARFPASTWSPNGRAVLQVVGQAGRVRAVDLATGAPLLEWQAMTLESGRPGWVAWTPGGVWDGSNDEAWRHLVCFVGGAATVLDERRDPEAVRAAIAALFEE